MDDLNTFAQLFRGRTDVWGSVTGKSNKENVSIENYKLHLEGKKSLGVYPLLDDGLCNFFAVDLDEKNFEKAKNIRQELVDRGIHMYIARSKGKGFHIYGFGNNLIAKDVRYVLQGVLEKLQISAEVFPKQDKLDEVIKYGNYINLPCFGDARPWLDLDQNPIPLTKALSLISPNKQDTILAAKETVPAPAPLMVSLKPKEPKEKEKKSKVKSPPCVLNLLKGVEAGARDEAAFALARHYLDQGEEPEEVLARLMLWDAKNKPPIGDLRALQTKVQSAEKGYAFGCNSITSGLLSAACVGQENCEFLKTEVKEKKKQGLIVESTFYEDDDFLYEEIAIVARNYEIEKAEFIRYNKETGEIARVKEIQVGPKTIWPVVSEEIAYQSITLPTDIEEYGTTGQLVDEIKAHVYKYADLPETFMEFAAWYVLMSWVYNRLPCMLYLRFLGDWGTGKSRSLDVIGGLCYKRMRTGGAVTLAPLFRLMKKYEGTLVIDEADFGQSDTTHEVVKILNSGIERGTPIMRCTKDNPDIMQVFPCFGPKCFATRDRFKDDALESRCLTAVMEETDRDDLPAFLAKEHNAARQSLRNKLLLFRFRNLTRIPEEISETTDIDLGPIEGRLKQVCIPFAMVFQDQAETIDRFKRFLAGYTKELRTARMDSIQGRIVYALFKTAVAMGKEHVTIGAISKIAQEQLKLDIKENSISRILHNMKFKTERKFVGGHRGNYVRYDNKLWRKIYRKYLHDLSLSGEEDGDYENEEFLTKVLDFQKV